MWIGVPRERKPEESRVGLTPDAVRELVVRGHGVLVEHGAGEGMGAADADYAAAGGTLVRDAAEVFRRAGMIVKVEEPLPDECRLLRPSQVLVCHLRLACDPDLGGRLVRSQAVCIAYECITDAGGGYPLLRPLSEIAGRLAVQEAGHYLTKSYGRGVLLGGVPGAAAARVVILGAGVAGASAAAVALATGAEVIVLDSSAQALQRMEGRFGAQLTAALPSNPQNIEEQVVRADVVIAAAREPGLLTPRLVSSETVSRMKKGSVMVDLTIDLGGCFETSHPTTHADPTYMVDFVVHHCVRHLVAAVPRTASQALSHAALPFVEMLAERGWQRALADDTHLMDGLEVALGKVTQASTAQALGRVFTPAASLF